MMWHRLLRNRRWIALPLLAALMAPWLSGMMAPCIPRAAAEASHCLQLSPKKPDASASRPACQEAIAKACIDCADNQPAVVQIMSSSPADAAPVAMSALWESPATHQLPSTVHITSPPTPLESTLSNRVLLI